METLLTKSLKYIELGFQGFRKFSMIILSCLAKNGDTFEQIPQGMFQVCTSNAAPTLILISKELCRRGLYSENLPKLFPPQLNERRCFFVSSNFRIF
jgi:hypothetical protein